MNISTRQLKVARLVQKELAEILRLKGQEWGTGSIISVTVVRVTSDLALATVYLSIFPSSDQEKMLSLINNQGRSIRFELGKKIGKQVRIIPEIRFFIDDSLDYASHIDELLES
ncbi:MAG: 30S ribosome-binding factor RbfA [Bacteroidales bacterium]|nr:30S ribosome-binding factor RbfA [Bacteroidales bacterium]